MSRPVFFLRSPVNGKPKEKEKKPQKKSAGNTPKKNTQANKTSIPDVNEEDLIPQAVKAEVDDDDVSVFESDYQTEEYRDDEYSSSYEEEDVDIDGKSSLKKKNSSDLFSGFKSSKIKMKNGSDFQGDDLRLDFSNDNPDHYFDSRYDGDDPKSQETSKKDSEYDDGEPNSQDYSMEVKGNLFRSGSTVNKKPLDKYERTEKSFESEDIDSEEDVSEGNGSSDGKSEGVESEEIGTDVENEILNHLGDDAEDDSEGGDSVGDDESVQSGDEDVREPRNSFEKFFRSDEAEQESESVEDTSDEGDLSSEESQSSLIISGESEGEEIGTKGGTTLPQKEIGGDQHKSSETKSENKPDELIDSEEKETLEDEIMNLADETGSDESLESSTNSKTGKKVSFEYSEEIDESRSEETSAELGSEELSDESRSQDQSSDESGRQEHSDDNGSEKTGNGSDESVSQEGSGKSQSQETKKVELEVSNLRPSDDTSSDESDGVEESKELEDILSESKLATSDKSESKHSTVKVIGKDQDGSGESKTEESLDELTSPNDSKENMTLEDEIMNHFDKTGQSEEKQDSDGDDIANLNRGGPPLVNRPPPAKDHTDPDNSDGSKELSSEEDTSNESRESPDRTISEGESEELGTSIESEILNHLGDGDEDSLGDDDSKEEEDGVNQKTSKESAESDKESRLVESLEKFFESSEPRRKHETSVESRSQELSDESTRQISSSESGNHKGSGKTESQKDEVESSSPVCQHETLSSPSNLQWVCEERGDQEFGDSCFLRCKDENEVPDSSVVSVCTPEGWIPHPKKVILRKKYL